MHILQDKSDQELHQSLLAEIAKSTNELKCARADIEKAQSRLQFCLAAVNQLLSRTPNP
jgi:hypothetical protein